MKFSHLCVLLSTLSLAGACSDEPAGGTTDPEPAVAGAIRIAPRLLTRVTDTHFETGDVIGLTVQRASGERYLDNRSLRFDGTQFAAESVVWYDAPGEGSTLIACYPYQESGLPEQFTVRSDQRGEGYDASNLIGACSREVQPTEDAVEMTFRHLMARIDIELTVEGTAVVEQITLSGLLPTVAVNWESQQVGEATGTPTELIVRERTANSTYAAFVAPQRAAMQVSVTTDAGTMTKRLSAVELQQGKFYTLQLRIDEAGELQFAVKGDIESWEDGGTIDEAPESDDDTKKEEPSDPEEPDAESELEYGGVRYRVQTVQGRAWMAENLRYAPAGARVYKPNDSDADVEQLGLLYSYQTALNGAAEGTEPAQGICPEGWRLPTIGELTALAETAGRSFFIESGHYMIDNSYSNAQSFILSSTFSNDRVSYLQLDASGGTPTAVTRPKAVLATSVRCVKAQ